MPLFFVNNGYFAFGKEIASAPYGAGLTNLFGGERRRGASFSPRTFLRPRVDLDTEAFEDSASRVPDVAIVAGAHFYRSRDAGDTRIVIRGSDNADFTAPADEETHAYTSADFLGRLKEDLVEDLNFSTARRFWRIELQTDNSVEHQLYKVFLGQKFFIGREPITSSNFTYNNANKYAKREIPRILRLDYRGISASKYRFFRDYFLSFKGLNYFYLYATDNESILKTERLMPVMVDSSRVSSRHVDKYDLTLILQEVI